MFDRTVMRAGAGAAMAGALLLLVFNLLHPRGDEVGAESLVTMAAEEGIWAFAHFMLGWGLVFGLLGLVVIARSLTTDPSASWGRLAAVFAVVGATLGMATIGMDGFAVRIAAEEASLETALAVAYVVEGLFVAFVATFIGITPMLYGIAVVTGDDYQAWLGWAVMVAGAVGVLAASLLFFGTTDGLFLATFLISSTAVTVWLGVMGLLLWQKLGRTTPAAAAASPSASPAEPARD